MEFPFLQKCKVVLGDTFTCFSNDRATKLSGSLAYSTIFSLPPMLLLIIISGGYFYGRDALQGKVFTELKDFIGAGTAIQIQGMIKALNYEKGSLLATVISVVALVIGATGVFTEIQSSLNHIWGVRAKPKKGFLRLIINRLISFSMIIGLGFLLIISLLADAIILALSHFLLSYLDWLPIPLISLFNHCFLFLILIFLFSFIYKVLPDVILKWRHVLPGALLTTLLFMLGKFFIGVYISQNNIISLYGAAGSVIILMVWVYFSALIFYLGAEFSKAWVTHKGIVPKPSSFAEVNSNGFWKDYIDKLKDPSTHKR